MMEEVYHLTDFDTKGSSNYEINKRNREKEPPRELKLKRNFI